jgi:aminoglycoside phosphotransferase (APT) family kinase protein
MNAGTNTPLPTPHGFGDDAESRRLRQRPPDAALRWVERSLDASVRGVRAYKGGSSSAMHGIRVDGPRGVETVVLRRYVIEQLNLEEPDIAAREASVLGLLERCPIPTPTLFAVDPTGHEAAAPSVLMSRVAGRVEWTPSDIERWMRDLAAVLPALHATPIVEADGVQPFVPYEPESWDPPAWLRDTRLWDRALDVFHGPCLDPDRVFIHRDFHPGNVLWRRGKVSGVVDWQAASIGPRAADVWHCRGNILGRFGPQAADRFLEIWRSTTGATYHPWTEAVMLVDAIAWLRPEDADEMREYLRTLLAHRLAELGASATRPPGTRVAVRERGA